MMSKPAFTNWSPFAFQSNPVSASWQFCQDIGFMLDSSNGAQLIENYQRAVDDIFAVNSGLGGQQFSAPFSLLTITPNQISDYQAYYDLLNVNGPVFRAIDRVTRSEPNVRYRVQNFDNSGLVPRFPVELGGALKATPFLELNPFEYYFFRFAQHLLTAAGSYPHADFDRLECVYIALLMDYLTSFLPADGVFPSSFVSSANVTSSTTPIDHRNGRYLLMDHQSTPTRSTPFGLLRRELFRENVATSGFGSAKPQPTKFSDILWKSGTLVSMLLDAWFNVPDVRPPSPSLPFMGNGLNPPGRGNALISGVVAVVNRTLIEHLHQFSYGPSSSILDAQFREFKVRFVPKMLDERMWAFLQYAFEKWPLDTSFRLLLELWFAYIQPWRYAYGINQGQGERNYDDRWEPFVKEHFGFYATFIRTAMARFLRMDLTACKNAFTLYRLAYTFSQPNLTTALGWATAGQLSPLRQNDSEGQTRAEIGKMVVSVAERARDALKFCQKVIAERKTVEKQQSWSTWILNQMMGEEDENSQLVDLDRARECLDVAVQNLENSFGFRLNDPVSNGNVHEQSFNTPFNTEKEPDCRQDDDGRLRLTPLGRRQVLNANRRFDFSRIPRPSDLVPVDSSIELGLLARILESISSEINAKYGRRFEILYRQSRGVIPWIFRLCLEPPTRLVQRNSPIIERRPNELKARINLRPLASYRFLFRFFCVFLCLGLILGFPTVMIGMTILLIVFTLCIYWVLEYDPRVRNVND